MRERSKRRGRQYAAIPNAMLRDETLSIEARGLLALLMTHDDNFQFHRTQLMKATGMGKDRFTKYMSELVMVGYVEVVNDRNEKGHLLGRTWIIRDEPHVEGEETEVRKTSTSADTEVRKNRSPEKPKSGKSAHIRKQTLQENQKEESPKPPEGAGDDLFSETGQAPEEAPKPEDRFPEFYEAYPRKIARGQAEKAWTKAVKTALPQTIIDGARRYAALCRQKGTEAQFIAHPATWLNGQRWADEDLRGVRLPEEITPQDRAAKFRPPSWQTVIR